MCPERDQPPQYTRYRAGRRLLPRRDGSEAIVQPEHGSARVASWRQRITRKRVALGILALVVGWVALSLVLFLFSSHFERTSPPAIR